MYQQGGGVDTSPFSRKNPHDLLQGDKDEVEI
jgi:hypothetical protein